MLDAFSLAAGLAWASGIRLYLTALLVGALGRAGLAHLPATLHFLSSSWALALFAVLALGEFLADKIPAFDSLWDALHTLIRVPAGALLAAAAVSHVEGASPALAAAAGGALALTAHLTKAGTRAMINLSPAPLTNWIASITEDVMVGVGVCVAIFFPLVFVVMLAAFLALAGWALPRLWRGVRGSWRGMASHMLRDIGPAGGRPH